MTTCESLFDRNLSEDVFQTQTNNSQYTNTLAYGIKSTVDCSIQVNHSKSKNNHCSSETIQLSSGEKKTKNKKKKRIGQNYKTDKNQSQTKQPHLREQQDTKSTDLSEINEEIEENHLVLAKYKSKKSSIDMSIEEQEQEETLNFLKGININDKNRTKCRLDDEFLEKIRLKFKKVIEKPQINDQFSALKEKLNEMSSQKKIFEKFKHLY